MRDLVHFIVAKSRHGWGVSVDADLVSERPAREEARAEAESMAANAREAGEPAALLDLSDDQP